MLVINVQLDSFCNVFKFCGYYYTEEWCLCLDCDS